MVNYTRKRGGKFIAQGTYGCVFGNPPLKCVNNSKRMDNSHISKLMRYTNAIKEEDESSIWAKVDPSNEFSLSALKLCKVDRKNIKSTNNYDKCEDKDVKDSLLIYKNGGIDLSKLKPHPKNYKPLFNAILNLMKGLELAHSHNIVHRDIKPPNIVAQFEKSKIHLRFIDYGLSGDVTNDKKYQDVFYYNDSYYPYWPLELGCFNELGNVLSKNYIISRLLKYNKYLGDLSKIYLGKINMDLMYVNKLIHESDYSDIKKTFKRVDVYGMGVLLVALLYEYFGVSLQQERDGSFNIFYYNQKEINFVRYTQFKEKTTLTEKQIEFHLRIFEHIIIPMVKLIEHMTDIDPSTRFTISESIKDYEKLLPAFDTYLDAKDVAEGLEGQYILNKVPDIPYIKTPTPKEPTPEPKEPTPKESTLKAPETSKKTKTRKAKNISIVPKTSKELKDLYTSTKFYINEEDQLVKISRALGSRVNFSGKTKITVVNDIIKKAKKVYNLDLDF